MNKTHKPTGLTLSFSGNAKGKTTSSIGLTVRALSYGWKILVVQMLKTDCKAFELLEKKFPDQIALKQYGVKKITLPNNLDKKDYELIQQAWNFIIEYYDDYDMVVLDEVLCSLNLGLFNRTTLWNLIEKCKEKNINLVLTGRLWSRSLLHRVVEKSSLFTECVPRKHYFTKHCPECHREFADNYDYNYCPFCTTELVSEGAHFGIELVLPYILVIGGVFWQLFINVQIC